MGNKKGQALVEFIIVLPVIIYILMVFTDFIIIFNHKNTLEHTISEVVEMYKSKKTITEINSLVKKSLPNAYYEGKTDETYSYLKITDNYKFITPGLSEMLGNPYKLSTERVLLNEKQ